MATSSTDCAHGPAVLSREERFYEMAGRELESGAPVRAIWSKAFGLAAGEEQKARALYLGLRAGQLERAYLESVGDHLRAEAPQITGGRPFVCPFCERQAVAVRKDTDFFVQAFTDAPAVRFYCGRCSRELVPGVNVQDKAGAPGPAPTCTGLVNNPLALTGFVLGLAAVPLYFIGVIPILAVVFSAIGLARFDPARQKNKWMAGVGLALGVVYTLVSLGHYGHLR